MLSHVSAILSPDSCVLSHDSFELSLSFAIIIGVIITKTIASNKKVLLMNNAGLKNSWMKENLLNLETRTARVLQKVSKIFKTSADNGFNPCMFSSVFI
ncbi:MAG: hypothetical protein WCP52_12085 [Bacteroidota bacterium]